MSVFVKHDLEGYEFKVWDGDCMMVVKEIVSRLLEEEEVSHFRKEDEEGDGGSKVREFDDLNNGKGSITWQSMECMKKDAKDGLAKQGNDSMKM
nr:hypothetical protein [Tanacetum cinerariifolium]